MSHSSKVCRKIHLQSRRLVPDPHPLAPSLIQAGREAVPPQASSGSCCGASSKGMDLCFCPRAAVLRRMLAELGRPLFPAGGRGWWCAGDVLGQWGIAPAPSATRAQPQGAICTILRTGLGRGETSVAWLVWIALVCPCVISFLPAPWGHLPKKISAPMSSSQALLLGEPRP